MSYDSISSSVIPSNFVSTVLISLGNNKVVNAAQLNPTYNPISIVGHKLPDFASLTRRHVPNLSH